MIRTCIATRLVERCSFPVVRCLSTIECCKLRHPKAVAGRFNRNSTPGNGPSTQPLKFIHPWNSPVSCAGAIPTTTRFFSATRRASQAMQLPPKTRLYNFHISTSYSPKQSAFNPLRDTFNHSPHDPAACTPSIKKLRSDAGQDAFFVASIKNSDGAVAVGVADGVGGYDESGIDSAFFAQGLCARAALAAHSAPSEDVNPKELIAAAYTQLLDEGTIRGGASTACVGVYRPDGHLSVANLGDSGFVILRNGKVLYASQAQTHRFNCPLQLAMVPKHLLVQAEFFGGIPLSDLPSDAFSSSHPLHNGDVVIFATDGVWDNLTNQGILRVVSDEMLNAGAWEVPSGGKEGIMPSPTLDTAVMTADGIQTAIAKAIVARAKSASINTKVDGPFAREVQRLYPGDNYRGGKRDDICVIATVVVKGREERQTATV